MAKTLPNFPLSSIRADHSWVPLLSTRDPLLTRYALETCLVVQQLKDQSGAVELALLYNSRSMHGYCGKEAYFVH